MRESRCHQTPGRSESKGLPLCLLRGDPSRSRRRIPGAFAKGAGLPASGQAHPERTCWDPKDGDLCPARTKPGETLVEVRSDSDVQIDRLSRV